MIVTITGADDAVNPTDLARLSTRYPFVEWGILFSEKREGQPRYPSSEWRTRFGALVEDMRESTSMLVSLHLCGRAARETWAGEARWVAELEEAQRVQLNGVKGPREKGELAGKTFERWGREFIVQVRSHEDLPLAVFEAAMSHVNALELHGDPPAFGIATSILFDVSGGQGIRPKEWPLPVPGVKMGFAGGINPENLLSVLMPLFKAWKALPHGQAPFWIDMETGVRVNDVFSLERVERVLRLVEHAFIMGDGQEQEA